MLYIFIYVYIDSYVIYIELGIVYIEILVFSDVGWELIGLEKLVFKFWLQSSFTYGGGREGGGLGRVCAASRWAGEGEQGWSIKEHGCNTSCIRPWLCDEVTLYAKAEDKLDKNSAIHSIKRP